MIPELLNRLRFLVFRKKRGELDDEIQFHLEQSTAAKVAAGLPAAEARRQAIVEFGGVEAARLQCAEQRPGSWMGTVAQDVRHGVRVLRKSPGFTAVAVLTLAMAIGANAVVFGVMNALILRPVNVPHAESLYAIDNTNDGWGIVSQLCRFARSQPQLQRPGGHGAFSGVVGHGQGPVAAVGL